MADNKKKRGGADRALIALTEKYEVAYWSKKLKVTPAKLKYAVKKVGHSAKKVEAYIQEQKHRAADKARIAISQAYEVRYPELKATEVIPLDTSMPSWAEVGVYFMIDMFGSAKAIDNYGQNLPRASVKKKRPSC